MSVARNLVDAAVAVAADPYQSVEHTDMMIEVMARVLPQVDRMASVGLTSIAVAADDLVEAHRSGPTWEARRRLARAVHNYFMRRAVEGLPPPAAGQGARDAA